MKIISRFSRATRIKNTVKNFMRIRRQRTSGFGDKEELLHQNEVEIAHVAETAPPSTKPDISTSDTYAATAFNDEPTRSPPKKLVNVYNLSSFTSSTLVCTVKTTINLIKNFSPLHCRITIPYLRLKLIVQFLYSVVSF
jgi:hypothetical protein